MLEDPLLPIAATSTMSTLSAPTVLDAGKPQLFQSNHDWVFLGVIALLFSVGMVIMTSASIAMAERRFGHPFYYTLHQCVCLLMGFSAMGVVIVVPIKLWFRYAGFLMIAAIFALILVLIPGIGRVVNGSARWISFGFATFQVSEFCKLAVVLYLSSYVVRHQEDIRQRVSGFIRPMILLSLVGALLILEPDFGATVVIMATAMAMLFLAGVPLWQYVLLLGVVGASLACVAISAPYRLARLTVFLDPWARPFDSGYQLTQALIAFGRGEWFGVGLGSSIQKLFYLPEAHTDFVFAVLAEELGLIGALSVLGLYILFLWRGMIIGLTAQKRQDRFAAFVCYGIIIWVGLQTLISMGVNTGLLPTKGLTLPFLSYGGSSVIVLCIAVGLLIRIDTENRFNQNRRESLIARVRK